MVQSICGGCPKRNNINPFSATIRLKRHQNKVKVKGLSRNNKVKVKGLGRNRSYLAGFSIFFSWFYEKVVSWLKKKAT